jgi:hypothetical protein
MAMSESSRKEPAPEGRYLKKMLGIIRSNIHQERINALFLRIKARLPELEELARTLAEAEEDGIYLIVPKDFQSQLRAAHPLLLGLRQSRTPTLLLELNPKFRV